MLSEQNLKKLDGLKKYYQTSQALVLPALWMVQEEHGSISEEAMKYVSQLLDVPYSHVLGVVTFYTMFHAKPIGKHHIEVCTNVSCMLRGSGRLVEHLEKRLGIKMGETSKDKKWTLSETECMGSCGTAPMIAVGEEYYENLTPEQVDALLAKLERK
jgi:NADH-quinone oxidoreductase subunit E